MKVYLTATNGISYRGRERWGDTIYDLPLTLTEQIDLIADILGERVCRLNGTVKYGHLKLKGSRPDPEDPRFVIAFTVYERACGSYNAFRFVPVKGGDK